MPGAGWAACSAGRSRSPRSELTHGVRRLGLGVALVVDAAVFAIVGLFTLLPALVKGVAVPLQSDALAALLVGGVFALSALGLGLGGRRAASLAGLEPRRTGRQVRQDVEILRERVDA